MNMKTILLLSFLIIGSFGFLKKKKMQNSITAKEGNPLDTLEKEVLSQLSYYRKNTLKRLTALDDLALREANYILNNDDFGKHTQFEQLADEPPREHFTQIAVSMQIPTFEVSQITAYATTIVTAIQSEESWYLTHEETYGGIKIVETGDDVTYLVVLHMIKPLDHYRHCKDSLFFEDYSQYIDIYDYTNMVLHSNIECDQKTSNGGWTLLSDTWEIEKEALIVDIKDLGFDYSELLWQAGEKYSMDYTKTINYNWDFSGFCFPINMFQIDNEYYLVSKDKPDDIYNVEGDLVRGTGFETFPEKYELYDMATKIEVLEKSTSCSFSSDSRPDYCANEFIMKDLPGKVTQFTDVESITRGDSHDNEYTYQFKMFVR